MLIFAVVDEPNFIVVFLFIKGFKAPLYSPNFLLCFASNNSIFTKLVSYFPSEEI